MRMVRQADMTNPVVAFRDFAKASKNQNPEIRNNNLIGGVWTQFLTPTQRGQESVVSINATPKLRHSPLPPPPISVPHPSQSLS